MVVQVISGDWQQVVIGPYTYINNTWGRQNLVNGTDYTQTITYDPALFPRGVSVAWDWPDPGDGRVLSYPALKGGWGPWTQNGTQDYGPQVRDMREYALTFDVNLLGATDRFNLALDLWLTSTPFGSSTAIVTEVFISLHEATPLGPTDLPIYTDPVTGYTAQYDSTPLMYGQQPILFVGVAARADFLSGTLDLVPILKMLMRAGVLSGAEYFNGFEFGNEVFGGAPGGMVINDFSHAASLYAVTEGNDVLTGTVREDDVQGRGGNDRMLGMARNDRLDGGDGRDAILGGAGSDTMAGGAGGDRFVFRAGDAGDAGGVDRIVDFAVGQDRIDLSPLPGLVEFIGGSGFSGAGGAGVRVSARGLSSVVQVDMDGDGRVDLRLVVERVGAMSAADFLL